MTESTQNEQDKELVGLLAEFAGPDELIEACDHARQAGYKKMDAYSPFPVHGIDDAIGIKRTILPFIVLAVGLGGCVAGIGMQLYCNATEELGPLFSGYKFLVSGKPFDSIPAFIPVTFEVIVLSSAFAAFLGMLALNKLPMFANPLFHNKRFQRVTNDGFFLMIETKDASFDETNTHSQLTEWGALAIDKCEKDLTDNTLPKGFQIAAILIATVMLIPPAMVFRALGTKNHSPRVHVNPDMDRQYKFRAQTIAPLAGAEDPETHKHTPLFADLRAMRPDIEGAVARGELYESSEMHNGFTGAAPHSEGHASRTGESNNFVSLTQDEKKAPAPEPNWVTQFPVPVTKDLVKRGQQRFNIYCSVCHGYEGDGNGAVAKRATEVALIGQAAWIPPKSLYDEKVIPQPIGRLFDTISNGRGGMGPYARQISVEDRWAIVLYVKALQQSRAVKKSDFPAGVETESVESIGPNVVPEEDPKKEPADGNASIRRSKNQLVHSTK